MIHLFIFIEGLLSFISPCILPMLPIYFSYIIGSDKDNKFICFLKTLFFTLGFTIFFVLLGILSGGIGELVRLNISGSLFNIISGALICLFGIFYITSFFSKIKFLNIQPKFNISTALGSFLFGIIFVFYLIPCAGPLLGAALTQAASVSGKMHGAILLLIYSLGLAIPFLICSLAIDNLKNSLNFFKKNNEIIKKICGAILIIIGILMIFGILDPVKINSIINNL